MDVIHQFNDSFFPKTWRSSSSLCCLRASLLLRDRSIGWLKSFAGAALVSVHEDKVIMALSGKVKVRDERSGRDIAAGDRFTIET